MWEADQLAICKDFGSLVLKTSGPNVKDIQVVAAELEQGPQGLQVRRPKNEGTWMHLCSVFVCFSCVPSFYNFHAWSLSFSTYDGYSSCTQISLKDTDLNKSSTFYTEYVLENSDAAAYFNKHVVGFTFASNTGEPNQFATTVWYSNMVSLTAFFAVPRHAI